MSASHSRAADSTSVSEHRLQIEGRAADDLEHVGGRGLLLQRFAQLVEQARVLDGDDGLGGEIRDQLDLLVGERAHLLAVDGDGADQLVFLEHRHDDNSPNAARASTADDGQWIAVAVGSVPLRRRRCGPVCLVCEQRGQGRFRTGRSNATFAAALGSRPAVRLCSATVRKPSPSLQIQGAEVGLAEARRIRQHGLEHRLQLAGRARDDAQHLGGRRLLLQRLGEFLLQVDSMRAIVRRSPSFRSNEDRERAVRLFAPLRDKVTSSAQSLVPSGRGPSPKDRARQS